MRSLSAINFAVAAAFAACCFYQAVFAAVRLLCRRRKYNGKGMRKYAVLIAARNEQAVIGQLLDSLTAQDYPPELFDVYVVADNCTDSTAQIAAAHGAKVYERSNKVQVGKGYALRYLIEKIKSTPSSAYDGYFVFDADNLLDPHYISEMNKVFSSGCRVVTGYRNTKNFDSNWITAGYGMWFLRESEYLNRPRDILGTSCAVSGTGFLFADSILNETDGWNWFLLTEDLEFTADMIVRGERIAYCHNAVLYDEQPTDFKQSIVQRSRWIKGYFQVLGKHGGDLVRTLTTTGRFACYDMLSNTLPSAVLTVLSFLVNTVMFVVGITTARHEMGIFFASTVITLLNSYLTLYLMGLLTLITERKRIRCSAAKKIKYSFTFPIFIFTYIIAMFVGIFSGAEWKPITHTAALSISDMGDTPQKKL